MTFKNYQVDRILSKGTIWDYPGNVCFPGGSAIKKGLEFDPWVRKIPWRRKWQPTPVFLPGKSHGHRDRKESDTTEWLDTNTREYVQRSVVRIENWGTPTFRSWEGEASEVGRRWRSRQSWKPNEERVSYVVLTHGQTSGTSCLYSWKQVFASFLQNLTSWISSVKPSQ